MKFMYWGKDSELVEKKIGQSPIEISSVEEERVFLMLSEYDVRIAKLLDEVKCPNCGSVNNFEIVRRSNMGIDYCECMGCHCEISNVQEDFVVVVDQDSWDTIVFGLCAG